MTEPRRVAAPANTPDTREVAGGGRKRSGSRGQRTAPSDYRREIRRLERRIQQQAKGAGDNEQFTPDELYQQLRLARAILAAKTGDEGEAFERPAGQLEAGEIIVARGHGRETGERLPVRLEAPRGP